MPISVYAVEGVTMRAMCLLHVERRDANAPEKILSLGHRLQMVGINAVMNATKMIELKALSNWPNQQVIREPVGRYRAARTVLPRPEEKHPVAIVVPPCGPRPTRAKIGAMGGGSPVLIDLAPESFGN